MYTREINFINFKRKEEKSTQIHKFDKNIQGLEI